LFRNCLAITDEEFREKERETCMFMNFEQKIKFANKKQGREYKIILTLVRLEVITDVAMKNVVFWDIKPQFVLHRRHITSPLESSQLMISQI
jgi:hypothetical protein